jgi:chemotaxis protein methyltransferase CheR
VVRGEVGAPSVELETIEIKLLLEGIFQRYGYDFRDYAPASLRRRVIAQMETERVDTISALQERVLHDPAVLDRLLLTLSIQVTSMFRDPTFYRAFREKVVPLLRTYPFLRVWHAGCATGEEVFSMAVVLHEEGLLDHCRIYATDISDVALSRARTGVFPLASMREYTENYLKAGGKGEFSQYYTANYDRAIFRSWLQDNVVFAQHNLVTDSSPNEFHVIVCRNVMIYFNRELQARVHQLFFGSLVRLGVLAIGRKEAMRFTPHEKDYEELDESERIYRKGVG